MKTKTKTFPPFFPLSYSVYRKAMEVSSCTLQASSTGQTVNLMSNDTERISRFFQFLNVFAISMPTIIVCLALLILELGWAAVIGSAALGMQMLAEKRTSPETRSRAATVGSAPARLYHRYDEGPGAPDARIRSMTMV